MKKNYYKIKLIIYLIIYIEEMKDVCKKRNERYCRQKKE